MRYLYFIILPLIFCITFNCALAEKPSDENILKLIRDKLSKWNSIQYTMDIELGGSPYGYRVYYKKTSNLTTISWNKNDSNDKVTMIVYKNTTTVFDHKKKQKQTHDTGSFDLFRINNEYDQEWTVEYLGEYSLPFVKDGKSEKRKCWVVNFITQQGVQYRFWIDQYSGLSLRMEVRLKKGDSPYVIAKTKSFKLDAPIKDSIFKDPF